MKFIKMDFYFKLEYLNILYKYYFFSINKSINNNLYNIKINYLYNFF